MHKCIISNRPLTLNLAVSSVRQQARQEGMTTAAATTAKHGIETAPENVRRSLGKLNVRAKIRD